MKRPTDEAIRNYAREMDDWEREQLLGAYISIVEIGRELIGDDQNNTFWRQFDELISDCEAVIEHNFDWDHVDRDDGWRLEITHGG